MVSHSQVSPLEVGRATNRKWGNPSRVPIFDCLATDSAFKAGDLTRLHNMLAAVISRAAFACSMHTFHCGALPEDAISIPLSPQIRSAHVVARSALVSATDRWDISLGGLDERNKPAQVKWGC